MATSPRSKMLHFTCTTCRERKVNTLFCTLVQPQRCVCPYFVDLHESCGGPGGKGLLHIAHPLHHIVLRDYEELEQFMIPTYPKRNEEEEENDEVEAEPIGTQWVFSRTDHVHCTQCDTMIGYRFIRMIGADDEKLSIVGDVLKIDDINSENPIPTYLLDSEKVTKFLTKRK